MPARSQLSPPLVLSLGTVQRTDEAGYGSIATKQRSQTAKRGEGGVVAAVEAGDTFGGRTDARRG